MKFSIITAVLNNRSCIGSCLESVRSQTYPDIEHIIVDGGSTDGTLEIIKTGNRLEVIGDRNKQHGKDGDRSGVIGDRETATHNLEPITDNLVVITHNLSRVSRLISEPDNGIYDALNKGIGLATGDVIGFLHADDIYADATVIETVAKTMNEQNADSCYGDLVYVRDSWQAGKPVSLQAGKQLDDSRFSVVRYWKSGPYERRLFLNGWMPPHPTFFVKSKVYRRLGGFNTSFMIAADYELMLRYLWKNNIPVCYVPDVLIRMRTGGASNGSIGNIIRKSLEDYRAMRMHGVGGLATLVRKNISKIPQFVKKGYRKERL